MILRVLQIVQRILSLHVKGSAILENRVKQVSIQSPYHSASWGLESTRLWCTSLRQVKMSRISHSLFCPRKQPPPHDEPMKKHTELVVVRMHLQKRGVRWFLRLFQPKQSLILWSLCLEYFLFLTLASSLGMIDPCTLFSQGKTRFNAYEVT